MNPQITEYIAKLPVWQAAVARQLRDAVHEAEYGTPWYTATNMPQQKHYPEVSYTAFDGTLPRTEIWGATVDYLKNNPSALIFLFVFLGFGGMFILNSLVEQGVNESVGLIAPTIVFGLLAWGVVWLVGHESRHVLLAKRFARDNNFTFTADGVTTERSGLLFDVGHSRQIKNLIEGNFSGRQFEIFTYSYVMGNGKNSTTYTYGVIATPLTRALPHVVLDSQKNNLTSFISNLPAITSGESLVLEGDFNKHFKVYIPKGYAKDALYFLTPELMAELIDRAGQFDVEVIGNMLYFYSIDAMPSKRRYQSAFDLLSSVSDEFEENTVRYADERVGGREINAVAVEGQRLQTGTPVWVKVLAGVFAAAVILTMVMQVAYTYWVYYGF